jgi:hypothetical protein
MAHKKKIKEKTPSTSYTVGDAIKIADEIFKLNKEKKYNQGAFIHGMIFALEYAQHSYKIPHQQMALIKRDCRRYFKEIENLNKPKS